MKSWKLSLCAAVASVGMGGAAFAQDDAAPSWSVNIAATSDYVFRGLSQTGEYDPAIQGGVDVGMGMFYAGVWGSNVKFGNGTDAEVDFYVGVTPTVGPVSLDFAAIYYAYVDAPSGSNLNYWEFKGAGSVPVGPGTLGATVYWSPDFTGTPGVNAEAIYYEANASFPVIDTVSVSGAIGRQEIGEGITDYTTWNIGATWNILPNVSIDTRYWDTNKSSTFGPIAGERVAVTLKAVFP